MDGVPLQLLSSGGGAPIAWPLLGAVVWMILTGRLVPRSFYREQKAATETYRLAYEAERDRVDQVLLPTARLQAAVLSAIPQQGTSSEGHD